MLSAFFNSSMDVKSAVRDRALCKRSVCCVYIQPGQEVSAASKHTHAPALPVEGLSVDNLNTDLSIHRPHLSIHPYNLTYTHILPTFAPI